MTEQPEAMRLADELCDIHTTHVSRNAADELRRLHAENEALRTDAERWQFVRVNCDVVEVTVLEDGEWYGHHTPTELDAAIDAARGET